MRFGRSSLSTVAAVAVAATVGNVATAFVVPQQTSGRPSASLSAASEDVVTVQKFAQPPRLVPAGDDLPTLYVYDHCPFCVRVRVALGLKNVKHDLVFLANDDVPTPTRLVGKKISPILEWKSGNIQAMAESMDIVNLCDNDERFGITGQIQPATDRTDLAAWKKSVQNLLRGLQVRCV